MYHTRGDASRACSQDDVRVCRSAENICLLTYQRGDEHLPEWVAYNQERDILLVRTRKDLIALSLYHVTVGEDQLLAVECFLFRVNALSVHSMALIPGVLLAPSRYSCTPPDKRVPKT